MKKVRRRHISLATELGLKGLGLKGTQDVNTNLADFAIEESA